MYAIVQGFIFAWRLAQMRKSLHVLDFIYGQDWCAMQACEALTSG